MIETPDGLVGVYPYNWTTATWADFGRFLASAQVIPGEGELLPQSTQGVDLDFCALDNVYQR